MKITIVLDPRDAGNAQGVFPGDGGDWWVAIDKGGYMLFERHADDPAEYRDEIRLYGAGHVTSSGWRAGELWTSHAGDVVRIPDKPGRYDLDGCKRVDTFHSGQNQVSLSPTRRYAVVRTIASGYASFRRYLVSDLIAGRDRQIGKTVRIRNDKARTRQSFGLKDTALLVGYGASNERAWLEQWSFTTGKRVPGVDDQDVTDFGSDVSSWREIECAPGSLVCMKVGTGSKRRLVVGSLDLPTKV